MTVDDWSAIAGWIAAASILGGWIAWAWHRRERVAGWFTGAWGRTVVSVLRSEVTAGSAWQGVKQTPEVSMEAGIAYARTAARSGHPPHTPTQGRVTPEQPLEYLLCKTAETVWAAASAAQQDLEPYLVPVRNYMTALAAKAGLSQARDFALGVFTERVRQEEDDWPDRAGDGKRTAHGTGNSHACLLETKHHVENALFAIGTPELRREGAPCRRTSVPVEMWPAMHAHPQQSGALAALMAAHATFLALAGPWIMWPPAPEPRVQRPEPVTVEVPALVIIDLEHRQPFRHGPSLRDQHPPAKHPAGKRDLFRHCSVRVTGRRWIGCRGRESARGG
jgi:hypothetical protein